MEIPMSVEVWRYVGEGIGLPCIIVSREEVGLWEEEEEGRGV